MLAPLGIAVVFNTTENGEISVIHNFRGSFGVQLACARTGQGLAALPVKQAVGLGFWSGGFLFWRGLPNNHYMIIALIV
jgi:hypothetical protein